MLERYPVTRLIPLLVGLLAACAADESAPPTHASLAVDGPYVVGSYTDFPDVMEFAQGTIYYPTDAETPVGGVAIAPGFTEAQEHIEWWGARLASHGFAVLLLDTNDPRELPDARAEALIAAVGVLGDESERSGSPIVGKVDGGRMAVMGHSMGGGGALLAANAQGSALRAAIPFTPWEPEADFAAVTIPTLVIAGSADQIAPVDAHAWRHFQSIPASTPKLYMEIDGGDHFVADTERGPDLATVGRYVLAWLKLYVDGDEGYRTLLYDGLPPEDATAFSRYLAGD